MRKKPPAAVPYVQPYRYASPDIPLAAIKRFARQIADRFHPAKIILFGSYAYGTPHAESDVDLLVIMPASDVINAAIRICVACDAPFSLDLIVRTPGQMVRGVRDDDWFLREIVEKGKTLYEAKDGNVGPESGGGLGGRVRTRRKVAAVRDWGCCFRRRNGAEVEQGLVGEALEADEFQAFEHFHSP